MSVARSAVIQITDSSKNLHVTIQSLRKTVVQMFNSNAFIVVAGESNYFSYLLKAYSSTIMQRYGQDYCNIIYFGINS